MRRRSFLARLSPAWRRPGRETQAGDIPMRVLGRPARNSPSSARAALASTWCPLRRQGRGAARLRSRRQLLRHGSQLRRRERRRRLRAVIPDSAKKSSSRQSPASGPQRAERNWKPRSADEDRLRGPLADARREPDGRHQATFAPGGAIEASRRQESGKCRFIGYSNCRDPQCTSRCSARGAFDTR